MREFKALLNRHLFIQAELFRPFSEKKIKPGEVSYQNKNPPKSSTELWKKNITNLASKSQTFEQSPSPKVLKLLKVAIEDAIPLYSIPIGKSPLKDWGTSIIPSSTSQMYRVVGIVFVIPTISSDWNRDSSKVCIILLLIDSALSLWKVSRKDQKWPKTHMPITTGWTKSSKHSWDYENLLYIAIGTTVAIQTGILVEYTYHIYIHIHL